MESKIAVVLPVYIKNQETLTLTENTLDSLGDTFTIIIDNGSSLGREYLESMSDIYIRNETNLGYAKAVNQGLKAVPEDIHLIAISNNDIRVSPNWQEVTRKLMTDPKIYSLHFRMIPYDQLFDYTDRFAKSGLERWCSQSFFVINREKELILFDEDFLNSYDDWDYQYRVRDDGYYTAYTEAACYQHKYSFTQEQLPEREENDKKNAETFKTKHGEYAEVLFQRMYPDQFKVDYWKGFEIKR